MRNGISVANLDASKASRLEFTGVIGSTVSFYVCAIVYTLTITPRSVVISVEKNNRRVGVFRARKISLPGF